MTHTDGNTTWSLHIKDTQLSDAGWYNCSSMFAQINNTAAQLIVFGKSHSKLKFQIISAALIRKLYILIYYYVVNLNVANFSYWYL